MNNDAMREAATELLTGIESVGKRFEWITGKPWWWVFTFWKESWRNYGRFEEIPEGDSRFKDARYEIVILPAKKLSLCEKKPKRIVQPQKQ